MKKVTFTFKRAAFGSFVCTKVTNSTKYLPGDTFQEAAIKKMVTDSRSNRLEEIILVN